MKPLGRWLQIAGLILAPMALVLQMTGGLPKGWQELMFLLGAVCVFCVGRLVEGLARN